MLNIIREPQLEIIRSHEFFHLHSHSRFSAGDALDSPKDMVAHVASLGQWGLAITDHGNMAASVELYKAARKHDVAPLPGSEIYFVTDRGDKKSKRYHLGLVAYTTDGYSNLCRISSHSHRRESFHHKPLIDFADLAEFKSLGWTKGIILTTGCYFSLAVQSLSLTEITAARGVLARLANCFETVVEIQKHNIEQSEIGEDQIAEMMFELANDLGLPIVLTQDAHYIRPEDKPLHDTLKRTVSWSENVDEAVFPGDGFHLCDAQWVKDHHNLAHWMASEEFFSQLKVKYDLSIPSLETYHYNIPFTVEDPNAALATICWQELAARGLGKPYKERLEEELSVLADTGMAGYLLIVKEITDEMTKRNIIYQARGSAAGSVAVWLCGITQQDPIKYKLLFERFMSRDRTKPPDIDLDIERGRRQEMVDWVKGRWPAVQVGTWSKFGIKDTGKGSLIVAYKKIARAKGATDAQLGFIQAIENIPEPDRSQLVHLSARQTYSNAGVGPAGIVLGDTMDDIISLIPTMGIPGAASGKFSVAAQYDIDGVEALGFVKMDLLGLAELTTMRQASTLLGDKYGKRYEDLPMSDADVFKLIRNGDTDGVFQLKGWTAKKGCKELGVRSLKDIIVVMALYRPAVMSASTGTSAKDTYIMRRNGREAVPLRHSILNAALKETYGLFVFQEQVITVLRDLGFGSDDLTAFLKAVKASNSNIGDAGRVIAGYEKLMRDLAAEKGLTESDINFIWTGIKGFAEYSFNRAHSTVYAIAAYTGAYLKTHHPLEFATAILQTEQGLEGESDAIKTIRQMGIKISAAHVNISGHGYSIDTENGVVRRGLVSIKGVGKGAAQELEDHAPYASIAEIIERCESRKVSGGKSFNKTGELNGVLLALKDAGALKGMQ